MTDIEQYVEELIEQGITDEGGAPIKCRDCGTSDFDESWTGDVCIEEIHITCKHCKRTVGHKSYGTWAVI